jgi:hypothetical protein
MVSWSTHLPPHKLIEGSPMLRQGRVSLKDLNEVEDIVTVSANSLFEAVALGLAQIKKNEWVADIATGFKRCNGEVDRGQRKALGRNEGFSEMTRQTGEDGEKKSEQRIQQILNGNRNVRSDSVQGALPGTTVRVLAKGLPRTDA